MIGVGVILWLSGHYVPTFYKFVVALFHMVQ